MKKPKRGFKPRVHLYHPGKNPMPRKIIESNSANIVKNTRQLRRAQQRGG
jgi:hypothetical protein